MKVHKRHEKKAQEIMQQAWFKIQGMNHESEQPLSCAMAEELFYLISEALQEAEVFGNEHNIDTLDEPETSEDR